MSEEKFDFGAMLDAQMNPFRQNFKFPKSFNDLKSVEPGAGRKAQPVEDEFAEPGEAPLDASLMEIYNANLPVDGKVEKETKGGYEVTVKGKRAFCPFSQIDRFRKPLKDGEDNPYVGQTFTFRIQEYGRDDRGENLIVSRRAQLDAEVQELRAHLAMTLTEGQTLNGTVVKVLDFGAFVDIGGVEGLVPVREISWDKVVNPRDFVSEGDAVTVKILSLDWERNRISLSIRQCQSKPLKPRTPEELAAEAEAADVREWMTSHEGATDSFSSLAGAFAGVKVGG